MHTGSVWKIGNASIYWLVSVHNWGTWMAARTIAGNSLYTTRSSCYSQAESAIYRMRIPDKNKEKLVYKIAFFSKKKSNVSICISWYD